MRDRMEEYNTEKEPLILKEYGRNVQKLIKYIAEMEDIDKRTQASHALIGLMRQLNPSVREHNDNIQRIWDHLHLMADFTLEIDAPFPVPARESFYQKPKPLVYRTTEPVFRHYGRNIQLLADQIVEMEDPDERLSAVRYLSRMMKSFYGSWNKDNIEDEVIVGQLKSLSKGKLDYSAQDIREARAPQNSGGGNNKSSRNQQNRKPQRRNNNNNSGGGRNRR